MTTTIKNTLLAAAMLMTVASCDLLTPGDIINPNVDEDTFLKTPNAMTTWVNGANRSFATAIGSYAELMEILSDNYFNNYSQSSKVFDFPTLLYTDADVISLQRCVGNLRETADYGLDKVAKADATTTREQIFNLQYIKGYTYLLAGEHFLALPMTDGGEAKEWGEQLSAAISTFNEALGNTDDASEKAFINTLLARAYYRLGDAANATTYAKRAIELKDDFVKQVTFDGDNDLVSNIQQYLYGATYGYAFQPLPRLDFLDPKYFQTTATEARPICIAKAEEDYMILAEAALASNNVSEAREWMKKTLTLVAQRPVQTGINDQTEGRYNGGYKEFPNSSEYRVAASAGDELRSGLVLDRQSPHLIAIPYISGTSVTADMVDSKTTVDGLLETLYLMRQEIFIAEGRRVADLGIRLPLCETEAANQTSPSQYTTAQIPPFIPLNQDMDAFEMDKERKTVVIKYNMNKVIVENKNSQYVAPFFK